MRLVNFPSTSFLKKFFFKWFCLFLSERERIYASGGGVRVQRERQIQNLKQAPGSELSAQSPTWDLKPRVVRS